MKIIFIIFLSIIFNINLTYSNIENKNIELKNNIEQKIFNFNIDYITKINPLIKKIINTNCYNNWKIEDNIDFVCKETWTWVKWAWCWIVINNNILIKDNTYCFFKRKDKEVWYKFNINRKYKEEIDITTTFSKRSIQERSLSCESSATIDILSKILDSNISESEVINKLPKSEFWKASWFINWERYWWDPDIWFVWHIDLYNWKRATQHNYEWFWVYEKPIQKVYDQYDIKTKIVNIFNRSNEWIKNSKEQLRYILKQFNNWNMIQLWGDRCTNVTEEDWQSSNVNTQQAMSWLNWKNFCNSFSKERILSWKTIEGKEINWLSWEHAFYLLGYKWWIYNPTYIIVWDTNTGRHVYSTSEWLRKWDRVDNRSIIVYTK